MDIFTLHMIFGLLFGALIAVCLGGMPVAVLPAVVLVIYFAVFFSGGSVAMGVWKRFYACENYNDEARAGECASKILASQRGMGVRWFGAAKQLYDLACSGEYGRGNSYEHERIMKRRRMTRFRKQAMPI